MLEEYNSFSQPRNRFIDVKSDSLISNGEYHCATPPAFQVNGTAIYRVALGEDRKPDDWQLALMTGKWPRVLVAPTGSGKTAAVTLGWAARRLRSPDSTPRRLIWCLPMRALVEQTADVVKAWFTRLATEAGAATQLPRPEDVHVLMGGVDSDGWFVTPERPTVIVGTQDMLLSRALMRGYASSRAVWPMEFSVLHEDALWVFDEVQLMGAGRATSAQLEAFRCTDADRARREGRPKSSPARSLWISATLDPKWLATIDHPAPDRSTVLRVDPASAPDSRLARLAHATKRLSSSEAVPASSKKSDIADYIGRLADAILAAHRPGLMTLAIVNRVHRAQALCEAIKKRHSRNQEPAPDVALIHSRFRPLDRQREMEKAFGGKGQETQGTIVVATQAVEAGIDISAAVLFTEIASWSSMVQRFGRANRFAEIPGGADVYWIDLIKYAKDGGSSSVDEYDLSLPYEPSELRDARSRLTALTNVAPVDLPAPCEVKSPQRVIRRKDLDDLFDTDPDLTGFEVDVSPYIREADDTDIRVFWRDLTTVSGDIPLRPRPEELCAVSISAARDWLRKPKARSKGSIRVFQRDPQWRAKEVRQESIPAGWIPLRGQPWPGLLLLADRTAGGYDECAGFTADPRDIPETVTNIGAPLAETDQTKESSLKVLTEADHHDDDSLSQIDQIVPLSVHLHDVVSKASTLCSALGVETSTRETLVRAARWHDLGKTHEVFQETMRRGLGDCTEKPETILAKTINRVRHQRPYFRHELASAVAFLAHEGWIRDADLVAYLIAAHHGKVRMNIRSLPQETAPTDGDPQVKRFARGVWEGDRLPPFGLDGVEQWEGGSLLLSVMDLGWDDVSRQSWTERTHELLARLGPFRLAWLETLLRIADWRASEMERKEGCSAQ